MARRRANGHGSISPRKDGRYDAAGWVTTTSGKRKRVRTTVKTAAEADRWLTDLKAKDNNGILTPDKSWRLDKFLDHWLETSKRRPLTLRRHESVVRLYLKPRLGHYKLHQLSVQTTQSFINQLEKDNVSSASIHQIRKVLSAALTYAVRQEFIARNVARLVELPKYRSKEAAYWTLSEAKQFLEFARSIPYYPIFLLLVLYGLRRGEVLGIRWRDVDFAGGVLHIRQQVQRINGELRQVELKTDTSFRDEPLLTAARDALMKRRREQQAALSQAGASWQGTHDDNELVFTTKTGRPIESHNVDRALQRISESHGVRRVTMHGLRHTNATGQKTLNVHDRDIQAILGHGDVRTTGIYQHIDMDSKRAALEKVETAVLAQQLIDGSTRSRQELPSTRKNSTIFGEVLSGGSSQTRTGDTRLFRPNTATLQDQLTSIDQVAHVRVRTQKIGCVAVNLAVNPPSEERSAA